MEGAPKINGTDRSMKARWACGVNNNIGPNPAPKGVEKECNTDP